MLRLAIYGLVSQEQRQQIIELMEAAEQLPAHPDGPASVSTEDHPQPENALLLQRHQDDQQQAEPGGKGERLPPLHQQAAAADAARMQRDKQQPVRLAPRGQSAAEQLAAGQRAAAFAAQLAEACAAAELYYAKVSQRQAVLQEEEDDEMDRLWGVEEVVAAAAVGREGALGNGQEASVGGFPPHGAFGAMTLYI